MAFVDVAVAVGGAVGLGEGAAAVVGGGALIGAGVGAGYSAITGDGNILNSALTGAFLGGGAAAGAGALGLGSGAGSAAWANPWFQGGMFGTASTPALVPASQAAQNTFAATQAAEDMAAGPAANGALPALTPSAAGPGTTLGTLTSTGTGLTGGQMLGYGLAGSAALSLLGNARTPKLSSQPQGQNPSYIRPYTYNAGATGAAPSVSYNSAGLPVLPATNTQFFNPSFSAQPVYRAAAGGLTPDTSNGTDNGADNIDFMGQSAYPMSQQVTPHYAVPSQMPTSAQQVNASYEPNTNPLTGEPISMKKGGKAEDDEEFNFNDLPKAKKEYLLDLMANPMTMPKMPGSDVGSQNSFEKYMMSQMPQGAFGRVGATKLLDDDSSIRAGLSGIAMAQPGRQGITTMPGSMDVGYNTRVGDGNVDLSAYRSINPMPGRGHAQGLNARYTLPFAEGGSLGGYSDGGRMLKGPGDGMSDDIPASIGNKQPARLADGEFVVPADVVSHLGNGSTDAGAKRLYAMMDNVRKARTGTKKQGKQIKAEKYLPK